MTGPSPSPLVALRDVVRPYGGLRPLRIRALELGPGDRVVLAGLDALAAGVLIDLITGATLPETGAVVIDGQPTAEIAADTEWLASLDRFGLVTDRAVLVPTLSIAANMALPLTLTVDPMSADTRAAVEALADEAGLPPERLDAPAGSLTPLERLRVHLARAVATTPRMLLLEHPTATLSTEHERTAFAAALRSIGEARQIAWLAISEDAIFAAASGGERRRLKPATGQISGEDAGWFRWRR